MRAIGCVILVWAGCSKSTEPAKAGSGASPPPGSGSAAIVVDGATAPADGATEAASAGDAGAAVDPRVAEIPEAGFLLATVVGEKLAIARLDRTGVKPLHQVPVADSLAKFGWLDADTLVVFDSIGGKDDGPAVKKIEDGKVVETVDLGEPWQSASLEITKGGEAWVARCTKEPEGAEDCTKFEYARVVPGPMKKQKARPANIDPLRVGWGDSFMGEHRPAPTVPAPPDVALKKTKLETKTEHGSRTITGMTCVTKGQPPVTVPDAKEHDTAYGYEVRQFRWVLADPPVYEVRTDEENPVAQVEKHVYYFQPCKAEAMLGFIPLGGALWGEYVTKDGTPDGPGEWVFRIGQTEFARMPGGALRTNQR